MRQKCKKKQRKNRIRWEMKEEEDTDRKTVVQLY